MLLASQLIPVPKWCTHNAAAEVIGSSYYGSLLQTIIAKLTKIERGTTPVSNTTQ